MDPPVSSFSNYRCSVGYGHAEKRKKYPDNLFLVIRSSGIFWDVSWDNNAGKEGQVAAERSPDGSKSSC
ncbi:hypothetical protein NL676_035394 [Syzygium grande]|nr:hypothetical protein NL676_035394 [Syzygium grande]